MLVFCPVLIHYMFIFVTLPPHPHPLHLRTRTHQQISVYLNTNVIFLQQNTVKNVYSVGLLFRLQYIFIIIIFKLASRVNNLVHFYAYFDVDRYSAPIKSLFRLPQGKRGMKIKLQAKYDSHYRVWLRLFFCRFTDRLHISTGKGNILANCSEY